MSIADGLGRDRVVVAVAAVTALGLAGRLVALGERPFHWDEARVGYWTLRYLATGHVEYRPVAGGPFLYVVGRHVIGALGATDATARLPVALVGGTLPLAALLFRTRLDDLETGALAAFLAANPLLVYYSRFLRGDLPAAAFALVAVGAVVRGYDAGDRRFAYVAAAAGGLALTASGFAVGHALCLAGAGLLVVDHARLFGDTARVRDAVSAAPGRVRGAATPAARALLTLVTVVVYFYAPRAGETGGPGLFKPATLPVALEAALVGSVRKFYGVRVAGRRGTGAHEIIPYVSGAVDTLLAASLSLLAFAAVAFLWDRYASGGPRPVVAGHAYWGGLGLFVFPVVTELSAPWVAVHVAVPLAVPAAVGVAWLLRYGVRAARRDDAAAVAAAALLLLAAGGQTGAVLAGDAYGPSEPGNPLAHYAQPADDLDPVAANVSRTADTGGVDVLYYGERFGPGGDPVAWPVGSTFGERLPLSWYVARGGGRTDGAVRPAALEDPPPVVIADVGQRETVAARLDGYAATNYRLALQDRAVVVFVRR